MAEIEDSLSRAMPIERVEVQDDRAALGAVVVLLDVDTGRELRLQLVSPPEASAIAGEMPRVSTESPVGRGLLGRWAGETFAVNLGRRVVTYWVVNVTS